MAILTYSARIAWARYLLSRDLYLAIGRGKSSWDTEPEAIDYNATALINEVGRKKMTRSFFVVEDDNGIYEMPSGRKYAYSGTPTRQIYLNCEFNYGEGVAAPVREVGVFVDTEIRSGLPETQTYFTPDQIKNVGNLILLEHLDTPETFTPTKKGSYGTILII